MKKFKKGDIVSPNGKRNGSNNGFHNCTKTKFIVTSTSGNNVYVAAEETFSGPTGIVNKGISCGWFYESELKPYSASIESFEEEVAELEKEINVLKSKINTMKELGLKEYDENVIKVHQTLTLIDKKGISKIEKAKAIAALINEG